MSEYTFQIWNKVIQSFQLTGGSSIEYQIPWHMYIVPNFLAVQGLAICLMFTWNRKTVLAIGKKLRKKTLAHPSRSNLYLINKV